MRSPRFFIDNHLSPQQTIILPTDKMHYAMRVLRLRNDDSIVLFNGQGGEYHGTIQFDKKEAQVFLTDYSDREAEMTMQVTLIQALPSGDKMEWIIEKATELGVHTILPIFSERSIIRLDAAKAEKKKEQWRKIAQSACEQCGRNRVPTIEKAQTLQSALQSCAGKNPLWVLDPHASISWYQSLQTHTRSSAVLAIGPEGGWSAEEQKLAVQYGAELVQLGERVLRTETTSLHLLSAIQTYLAIKP